MTATDLARQDVAVAQQCRTRLIADDVLAPVIDCLNRNFPGPSRDYWVVGLRRMSQRAPVEGYPHYGYALEAAGRIVGVILIIVSRNGTAGATRCNLSSWCVDPQYRAHALLLHMAAVKHRDATYLNISPAVHTRATIEALGFRRFSNGQFVFIPLLSSSEHKVDVREFAIDGGDAGLLSEFERQLLVDHAALGCRALLCVKDGTAYPFVFQNRKILRSLLPCPQLIYCRSLEEFVRFANPIGRHLLRRTGPICIVDAKEPIAGLAGRYFAERYPKYFKGPNPPGLGDLSYTEQVVLGF